MDISIGNSVAFSGSNPDQRGQDFARLNVFSALGGFGFNVHLRNQMTFVVKHEDDRHLELLVVPGGERSASWVNDWLFAHSAYTLIGNIAELCAPTTTNADGDA